MVHRPSEPPPPNRCCRTQMRSLRSQSTGLTGRSGIRRARSPRPGGWPTDAPPRASPTAEVSTDRSSCTGGKQGGRTTQEPTGRGSTVAAKGRPDTRAKVCRPAGREHVHVERSLLKPSGVVGDERECAETDLVALHQNSARNHDDLDWKRSQLLQQIAKTPAPRWAPTFMVLSLTVM